MRFLSRFRIKGLRFLLLFKVFRAEGFWDLWLGGQGSGFMVFASGSPDLTGLGSSGLSFVGV